MSQVFYRQCLLSGTQGSEVAWIPEKFAVSGKCITVGKDKAQCVVVAVGEHREDGDYLMEHERNYLSQREASDV